MPGIWRAGSRALAFFCVNEIRALNPLKGRLRERKLAIVGIVIKNSRATKNSFSIVLTNLAKNQNFSTSPMALLLFKIIQNKQYFVQNLSAFYSFSVYKCLYHN
jgi:hypothetical protein